MSVLSAQSVPDEKSHASLVPDRSKQTNPQTKNKEPDVPKDKNNREHIRTKLRADIKVSHPDVGDLNLHTENISDSGAYILAEGHELPQPGELVQVQVQGMGSGEAPVLTMRVIRTDGDGMGLEFVRNDE